MDKQLTLAMQYEANKAGITLPWEKIGARMGEKITGGAVIQHLAKMRSRLVEQGNPVPPSLKRGGGASRDPTTTSSASTMVKNSPAKKATPTKSRSAKLKKASKKASRASDDSDDNDDDDDDWDEDESDADYGQPRAKRVKKNAKGATRRKNKGDESDEEAGNFIDAPMGEASKGKRKRQNTQASSQELSAYGTTDINGLPIDNYNEAEDDTKTEVVAAGSSWLSLDDEAPQPKTGKVVAPRKSLVVSLPSTSTKGIKEEETSEIGEEEIGEDVDDGSQLLSNEENEQEFYTPQNNQDGDDLSATQLNSGYGPANDNVNSYQRGSSHITPLKGEYNGDQPIMGTLNTDFNNNNSAFQPSGGLINDHEFLPDQATGLSAGYYDNTGSNFGLNAMDFNGQNVGALGGGFDGYNEGRTVGGSGLIPYPIQTSWPSSMGQSSNTSLNQTPAAPSAGADFSGGYFNSNQHEYQGFDDGTSSTLFNDGVMDENFVDGGWYGSSWYSN